MVGFTQPSRTALSYRWCTFKPSISMYPAIRAAKSPSPISVARCWRQLTQLSRTSHRGRGVLSPERALVSIMAPYAFRR